MSSTDEELDSLAAAARTTLGDDHPFLAFLRSHHIAERGWCLDFRDRPMLWHMIEALENPTIRVIIYPKCTQIGISSIATAYVLWRASLGGNAAFLQPTGPLRQRYAVDKLARIIEQSEPYRRITRKNDAINLRRVGNGVVTLLTGGSMTSAVSSSYDAIVVDEAQFSVSGSTYERVIAKLMDRMSEAVDPCLLMIGNPGEVGQNILRYFENSDQQHWYNPCPHCDHWQHLGWETHVMREHKDGTWTVRDPDATNGEDRDVHSSDTVRFECSSCGDFFVPGSEGTWVAHEPGKEWRGYHVSRLCLIGENIANHVVTFNSIRGDSVALVSFYNSVLGKGLSASGMRINTGMIERSSGDWDIDTNADLYDYRNETVIAGIDIGKVHNVIIARVVGTPEGHPYDSQREVVWMGAVSNYDELSDVMRRFHVDTAVVDSLPEVHATYEWAVSMRAEPDLNIHVLRCIFAQVPRIDGRKFGMRLKYGEMRVNAARTQLMDSAHADFGRQTVWYPRNHASVQGFVDQMGVPVRILNEKDAYVWTKGSADHYCLANSYLALAHEACANLSVVM